MIIDTDKAVMQILADKIWMDYLYPDHKALNMADFESQIEHIQSVKLLVISLNRYQSEEGNA